MQFFVGVLSALRLCVSAFGFLSGPLSEIIDGLRSRRFRPAGPPLDQLANTQKRSHAKPPSRKTNNHTKNVTSRSTPLPRPPHPASGHPLPPAGRRERGSEQTNEFVAFFRVSSQIFTWYWARRKAFWGHRAELRETTLAAARKDEREPRLYEQAVQPRRPVTSRLEALGCAVGTTSDRRGGRGRSRADCRTRHQGPGCSVTTSAHRVASDAGTANQYQREASRLRNRRRLADDPGAWGGGEAEAGGRRSEVRPYWVFAGIDAVYESDVGVRLQFTLKPPGGTWRLRLFSPVTGAAIVIWVCDAVTAPLINTDDESPLAVTIVLGPLVIL